MTQATSSPHGGAPHKADGGPIPVILSVPAVHTQLPVIRLLTEVVAMNNACTLDQSADLKLAVDQVCTLLIDAAAPETEITCRYQACDERFRVEVVATTIGSWRPTQDSLEWRILGSLTDTITISEESIGAGHTRESRVLLCIGTPA